MHGREHLVGITAQGKGLVLVILRYADELRKPELFREDRDKGEGRRRKAGSRSSSNKPAACFEPQRLRNEYARAVHELVQAKIEQRAPQVAIEPKWGRLRRSSTSWNALKKGMQARGQVKVREAVQRRMGKEPVSQKPARVGRGKTATNSRCTLLREGRR